jgi:hypothetical protein
MIIDGIVFKRILLEETHHETWAAARPNGTLIILTRGEQLSGEWAVTIPGEPEGVGDTAEAALASARTATNMSVMRAMNTAAALEERRDTLHSRLRNDIDEGAAWQT